ncbi:dickkopf-related protein 2 isoform X2 [Carettochelys insculpta]|uniref:dickkopf-related protein 2 isoform X2 n=1 Tax=Carettochelys insculpta TaxID=44489 RepID=UPI003EB947EE
MMLIRNKYSCCLLLLAMILMVESSQLDSSSSKVNSIKSTLMGEAPTQATNRSAGIHQGLALGSIKKGKLLRQMGKPPKHHHRQGEVYPCTNDKECEVGRYCHSPHQATSACMICRRKKKRCHRDGMCCPGNRCNNGHEGDPCLRSSDCMEGYCCARHFWTKICKPVLHQGEVCTKQRKKGSHGLEIFQRCDCAKGLSCKVWKDATYSSKSRLHVCQKI